jgi:hypothetical protein
VIRKEVECALKEAMEGTNIRVNEFVAQNKSCKLPYHEWFIEFENEPEDDATFKEARQCYEAKYVL